MFGFAILCVAILANGIKAGDNTTAAAVAATAAPESYGEAIFAKLVEEFDVLKAEDEELIAKNEALSAEVSALKTKLGTLKTEVSQNTGKIAKLEAESKANKGPVEITEHGTAGGSPQSHHASFTPSNAFQKNNNIWHSERGFPQSIWMHYQKAHRLRQIGITSSMNEYAPRSFEVIGSMDCVHWTTIFNIADAGFGGTGPDQRRSWVIPLAKRRSFPCIGLRVNSVWNMGNPYCRIKQIDLWE